MYAGDFRLVAFGSGTQNIPAKQRTLGHRKGKQLLRGVVLYRDKQNLAGINSHHPSFSPKQFVRR